jgi:hypothetical protein
VVLGRVVEPGEPLWLPEDLDWAVALLEEEQSTCKGCGHPLERSLDLDAKWQAELVRCHACAAAERTLREYADAAGEQRAQAMAGLSVRVSERSGNARQ